MTYELYWKYEPQEVTRAWEAYCAIPADHPESEARLDAWLQARDTTGCHVEFAVGAMGTLIEGMAAYRMVCLEGDESGMPPVGHPDRYTWQPPGIRVLAVHKFQTNDPWLFTPEQIVEALWQYTQAVAGGAPPVPACCANEMYLHRWERLLHFWRTAVDHGGAVAG